MKIVFWGVYSKRAGKGINRLFLAILLEKENKPAISYLWSSHLDGLADWLLHLTATTEV